MAGCFGFDRLRHGCRVHGHDIDPRARYLERVWVIQCAEETRGVAGVFKAILQSLVLTDHRRSIGPAGSYRSWDLDACANGSLRRQTGTSQLVFRLADGRERKVAELVICRVTRTWRRVRSLGRARIADSNPNRVGASQFLEQPSWWVCLVRDQ